VNQYGDSKDDGRNLRCLSACDAGGAMQHYDIDQPASNNKTLNLFLSLKNYAKVVLNFILKNNPFTWNVSERTLTSSTNHITSISRLAGSRTS
jgi:hypothetical protein